MEQENRERIVRLEERVEHYRQRSEWEMSHLGGRLTKLESRPSAIDRVTGTLPLLKVFVALALVLLAFLLTGDLKAALRVVSSVPLP